MLTKKTRHINKGFSAHLRKGWQRGLAKERKRLADMANTILEHFLEDAKNGKLIIISRGYQATSIENRAKLIFFTESDTTAVTFIEPKRKIIWDTQITGIPNL